MDFNDIARRNSAWTQAYRNVAKPSGATPSAGTSSSAPEMADRSQLKWSNIQRDARQRFGDNYGKPTPEVVLDARRNVTAGLMGGVPMNIMDAKLQGRRDAAAILGRAAADTSPSVSVVSPLGSAEAANFRKLAGIEKAKQDKFMADWEADKIAYRKRTAELDGQMMNREQNAISNPEQLKRDARQFSADYLIYKKGGGSLSTRDYIRQRALARSLSPDLTRQLQENYGMDLSPGNLPGEEVDVFSQRENAMAAAAAERAARDADRSQRAERMSAINQFRSSGVLPSDPDIARAIVAGAGVAGNPFAAAMARADAERQAAMEVAQRQLDAQKYAADAGLKGREAETAARVAEAEAARAEAARRFDAQMAEVERRRRMDEEAAQLNRDRFEKEGASDIGSLQRLKAISEIQQYNPESIGRIAEREAMMQMRAMNPNASLPEIMKAGQEAKQAAMAEAMPLWESIMSDPALAEFAPRANPSAVPGVETSTGAASPVIVPGADYRIEPMADNTTLNNVARELYNFYGRMPTVDEVREQMRAKGIGMRIPSGWAPRNLFEREVGNSALESNYMF